MECAEAAIRGFGFLANADREWQWSGLMNMFDYGSEAALFVARGSVAANEARRHIPFALASHAIRYAVETLAPGRRGAICLQVNDVRFDSAGIRRLYKNKAYPLRRKPAPGHRPE